MSKQLIKLYQPACNPCTMVSNFLNDQGIEHNSIDVTENPDVAAQYGIMSTPVTILLDEGVEIQRSNGFNPPELEEMVEKLKS
ncbi:thiol reductase thioredoxin [Priestia filamentosa]|uniref:Thiol reductase thioredoxin n=1 Tax=Priestia filamentosa TaxID=1402861 RepID=A0A0H4KEJ5_9BACI|nr:thioredoxin family protein [Priestia filamentosa]AKO92040.1 thiol reductase thioredoxin [Priestia filamentosa]